jgi:carboxypeptidase family protein
MQRLCLFIAIICFALRCFAQDVSTGAIRGVVLDPSNHRIVKASIVLLNDATGLRYEHFSDGVGQFAFELVPPGDYSARATADGMSPQISPGVRVTLGAVTELEFKLSIAGAHENVTVSAEPKQVETEPRGLSSVVDERAILGLPLNGRRFTPTEIWLSGGFAAFRPAIWLMGATIIMVSSHKRAEGIVRPISFPMKSFRSSACRRTQARRKQVGQAAR